MVDALAIGYAIKDRRAELGLTQAEVADAAGISKRCLWSLELGQNSGVQLDKLTAVLGVLGLDLVLTAADASDVASQQRERAADAVARRDSFPSEGTMKALDILTGGRK